MDHVDCPTRVSGVPEQTEPHHHRGETEIDGASRVLGELQLAHVEVDDCHGNRALPVLLEDGREYSWCRARGCRRRRSIFRGIVNPMTAAPFTPSMSRTRTLSPLSRIVFCDPASPKRTSRFFITIGPRRVPAVDQIIAARTRRRPLPDGLLVPGTKNRLRLRAWGWRGRDRNAARPDMAPAARDCWGAKLAGAGVICQPGVLRARRTATTRTYASRFRYFRAAASRPWRWPGRSRGIAGCVVEPCARRPPRQELVRHAGIGLEADREDAGQVSLRGLHLLVGRTFVEVGRPSLDQSIDRAVDVPEQ